MRASFGSDVARLRSDAGLSQRALGRAAGVDSAFISRIEAGAAGAALPTYVRLSIALGADLSVRLYPNTGPTIRDRHQTKIAEALLQLIDRRWRPYLEIAVRRPSRGWIDLGLHDSRANLFIAVEIQSELRRVEQLLRWAAEKAAGLPSWEGWTQLGVAPRVSQLLVVRETRRTRAIAREFRRVLATAYPGDPEDALAALTGHGVWPGAALLWASDGQDVQRPRFRALR